MTASVVLAVAGVLAGMIGAAGGITSLVSYSALLACGVPTLPAAATNLVASVACWPGSALTSRRELSGSRGVVLAGLPVAAGGAAAGSLLLLGTPPGLFARVVPLLVAAASVLLLVQPWLTERAHRHAARGGWGSWLVLGAVAVYAGYFGAGSGILFLVALLVLVDDRLPQANAVKNMFLGAGALASVLVFGLAGPVDWAAAAPLALGLFAGSTLGPVITRRAPAGAVRIAIAVLGLLLAVELWLRAS